MKIKRRFILLLLFLGVTGCTLSKEFINTTETRRISKLNEKLATHRVEIELTNGERITPDSSKIVESKLHYYTENSEDSVPLSEVRFLKTSPKLSYSTLIGAPLIIYGGVTTYLYLDGKTTSEHWTIIPSLPALVFGLGIFVFGNTVETDVYYFSRDE